jgi:hypothetical protein
MAAMKRWAVRLGALFTTLTLTVLIPAAAWASTNGVADALIEERRRRSGGGGGFFLFGAVCCIGVVVVIALIVFLVARNRKRK